MKKVYFFIGTLSKGGAERTVSNLTLYMDPAIEKHIILFGTQTRLDYPVSGQIHYLDEIKRNTVLNKSLMIFRRIIRLNQLKRSDPAATFISLLEYPNLINVLSGFPQRSILSVRNHMSTKHRKGLKAWFWNLAIRLAYHRAQSIIAVSQDIRRDLIEHYRLPSTKIVVIYNAYELAAIRQAAAQQLPETDQAIFQAPVIINMGRMNRQKGQWHLIRAFSHVLKAVPEARLVILGEGQYQKQLKQLAQDCGVGQSVYFPGFQSNPHAWIAKSEAFVLSSLFEGFPNALAEAMACGVPVLSTDCHSGPREILAPSEIDCLKLSYGVQPGRFGLLYPVDSSLNWSPTAPLTVSEEQLADLMTQLLKVPELKLRYAQLSLDRMADFEMQNIVHQWETRI